MDGLGYLIGVVRAEAKRLARRLPSTVELDDLTSAGFLGLADAMRKRDASSPDFPAYAVCRIRGEMKDFLRWVDSTPREWRNRRAGLDAETQRLTEKLGREPTEAELEAACGAGTCRWLERRQEVKFVRLDAPNDGSWPLEIADDGQAPDEAIHRARQLAAIYETFDSLPQQPRRVATLYYRQGLRMREIAQEMGLTEGRICQVLHQALQLAREVLESSRMAA